MGIGSQYLSTPETISKPKLFPGVSESSTRKEKSVKEEGEGEGNFCLHYKQTVK